MKLKVKHVLLLGVVGLTWTVACDVQIAPPGPGMDATGEEDETRTGKLRLLITDKPFPFDAIKEAVVTFTRVEVRVLGDDEAGDDGDDNDNGNENGGDGDDNDNGNGNENGNENDNGGNGDGDDNVNDNGGGGDGNDNTNDNGDNGNDNGDDDDGGSPFVVIFEGEQAFDLLDLQNGRTALLADADIPAGTYTQMRLIVTEGTIVLNDEAMTEFNLRVPSGAQSGIKLRFRFEVQADTETTLLLDVDLSRAFKPIPGGRIDDVSQIERFQFQPSLAMRLIDLADTGGISGTVTDPDGNPIGAVSVTAFEADQEVTTTSTEEDGTYTLSGLEAATYRVEFSASGFEDSSVDDVSVTVGETTEGIDMVMTPTGDGDGGG